MTSSLCRFFLAFALTSAAASAAAQATRFPPPPPPEMAGPYVGATLGYMQAKAGCLGVLSGGGRGCDSNDMSWGFFGGYRLRRHLAAEASYRDLGRVTATGPGSQEHIHGAVFDLTALGILPLDDQLAAYLRFGGYRATLDTSVNGVADHTNGNLTYGAGVQFDFAGALRNLSVRLDWQRYKKVGVSDQLYGVNYYDVSSLGVVWRFR